MRPIIAVTTWMRTAPTFLSDATRIHTLGEDYAASLDLAGAVAMLIGRLDPADVDAVLDRVDGLLVTGGGDFDPARYGAINTGSREIDTSADARDLALIEAARRRAMPVLGICRGLQAINIAAGGTLHQEVNGRSGDHPALATTPDERNAHRHVVRFAAGSRLARIYDTAERKVNSLHHQGIDQVGEGLVAVATTADGGIEAVESADASWPVLAVQWHPEMLNHSSEEALFAAFVADAGRYPAR